MGAAIGGCIILLTENKPSKLYSDFEQAKKDAVNHIKDSYDERLQKIKDEYLLKEKSIKDSIESLNNVLKNAEEQHKQRIAQIQEATIKSVDEESQRRAETIANLQEYYTQQEYEVHTNYQEFKSNIDRQIRELKQKLKQEEERYNEVINEFQRQEQIKKNKDFYRIVLTESEIDDVRKLKGIAAELHDPSILYKLIYKTYYERPFNEMTGRVVTGRGSIGIYKITNLENGRVYIGQTRQAFKERWRTHVKRGVKAEIGTANKLYAAMWEDGVENFTFEVLSECSVEELNSKEKEYIAFYHADTWGYNSNGGNNG